MFITLEKLSGYIDPRMRFGEQVGEEKGTKEMKRIARMVVTLWVMGSKVDPKTG